LIEAAQPGSYTLTVTNDLGCTDTDQVEVDANLEVPTATANISQISCFGSNDGTIQIDNVNGGTAPYVFSFNDSPFTAQNFFSGLSPDTYTIVVRDQNGCFSELTLDITQPTQIAVSLTTNLRNSDNLLIEGDSVRLEALFDPAIQLDTIIWKPDSIPSSNSTTIWVSPSEMTRYSVTIVDENGCNASDEVLIVVQKVRPVYISNVFSPNNDGFNDIFYIQAGSQVTNVRKFVVFNRWGESMISLENFQPNDPAYGWDGTFRNQPANAAVFTYFAEIEFNDGEVILYKGDVTLMR
jgi:gliding motility-associated-like protein